MESWNALLDRSYVAELQIFTVRRARAVGPVRDNAMQYIDTAQTGGGGRLIFMPCPPTGNLLYRKFRTVNDGSGVAVANFDLTDKIRNV